MAVVTLKRSDGKQLIYGDVFKILSYGLTGAGTMNVEIFSENKAIGDGDVVTGQRLPPRSIHIGAVAISRAANEIARRIANDFFSPLYEYELHLDYKGNRAWIPCLLEVFDLPTENVHRPQALNIEMFCPDPYFLSEDSFGKNIANITGMAGFPYMEHPVIGWVASVYDFSQSVLIVNEGDATTYPAVRITARGQVVNPTINKDGLFVKVLYTMQDGDVIVIDFDAKTVTLNGENFIQNVSKDSSLTSIGFEVGANTMEYDAEDGANVMSCYIYYNEKYVGV